jgi:ATP-dependent helicase HrpB
MIPLPIDPLLAEITATLSRVNALVLEAPPGAGKTTRVPRAMLDAGIVGAGEIVVLQPRRLAARLAARRVAEEFGERLGETIGYQVRFEESASAKTRVRFVTEGILTRRLLSDPMLTGIGAVVLDEFHERHLHGDVALAMIKQLQRRDRRDLKLVVMSATLDAAPVSAFLDDAPALRSEGRRFDVAIEYLAKADDRPLSAQVASAVQRLVAEGLDGDILVFLPGAAEIRRAIDACAPIAHRADLLVLPLHGDLPPAEQDRAVKPADRRKVILSTNVAETSVTIDGVVAVIDSGLARMASHAPWSGMPVLRVGPISRASATQRAGRAGRTREGRCIRLYTKHDHDTRPSHDAPEIKRLDLAETVLELRASGVDPARFAWFEAPPAGAIDAADLLLARLGALDEANRVTPTGRRMLRFPVHPRQGRMIVEAEQRGVAAEGCVLAAIVGERDMRTNARMRSDRGAGRAAGSPRDESARSDLVQVLEAFETAELDRFAPHVLRDLDLEAGAVSAVDRVRKQLVRLADRRAGTPPEHPAAREIALLQVTLAGYPDRVGRLRVPANATGRRGTEIVFATGGTAQLADASVVRDETFVTAIDAEERRDARGSQVLVRMASAVEADWLLGMFTERVKDTIDVRWHAQGERVEVARRLTYEGMVLEETPARDAGDPSAIAKIVVDAAMAKGIRAFVDADAFDRFVARLDFARRTAPHLEYPALDDAGLRVALEDIVASSGFRTFADLRNADLLEHLRARLTNEQSRQLDALAPERIELAGGRRARIEYPKDGAPFMESRLQDFFGMREGPKVANGRVPVVLHLLAPNQRAVQVTTDLAGFWVNHYPQIAKELRRRYPKHKWPDNPV